MLLFYLGALVLGLGVLTLQFIMPGGSSHASLDGGIDVDGDGVADGIHGDGAIDIGSVEAVAGNDGLDQTPAPLSAAGILLSMRFWTYALMAFGLIGVPFSLFNLAGSTTTLISSILVGLMTGAAAALVFHSLKKSVTSQASHDDMVGSLAIATMPFGKGSLGKIRLVLKGQRTYILAITDSDNIDKGEEVVIIDFRNEHARVEPIGKPNP